MLVPSLSPASSLPPVSPVSPISRVVRRAKSSNSSETSRANDGETDEAPLAAMRTPAEVCSNATREALSKLELGG